MNKLKQKLRKWLGIDTVEDDIRLLKHQSVMIFDIGYYDPTIIIIATGLGGGRVKIIHCHSGIQLREIKELESQLAKTYGRPPFRIVDAP